MRAIAFIGAMLRPLGEEREELGRIEESERELAPRKEAIAARDRSAGALATVLVRVGRVKQEGMKRR